jgi:leucyl-tRNA---protein transferase
MFAIARSPQSISDAELDNYLAQGWFRMGQSIFTTNFIHFKNEIYSTIWLRILLDDLVDDGTQKKLFKRNSNFTTDVQRATITEEKEELYYRYKESLPFQPTESLRSLLLGFSDSSIYNTYEVTVHDGDKLIAIGFFDLGKTSAEGITSVYDPDYKKYSLGKYLIYKKIEFCKTLELHYFYPGYFVPGYPFFDYKLKIGRQALQFLQVQSGQWTSIDSFSTDTIPYEVMRSKLLTIQKSLTRIGLTSSVIKYEYFDANLIPDLRESELFDFPIFLFFPTGEDEDINPVIVFDVRDNCYHLLTCVPIWKPAHTNPDNGYYSAYFIKTTEDIYATADEVEIAVVFFNVVEKRTLKSS